MHLELPRVLFVEESSSLRSFCLVLIAKKWNEKNIVLIHVQVCAHRHYLHQSTQKLLTLLHLVSCELCKVTSDLMWAMTDIEYMRLESFSFSQKQRFNQSIQLYSTARNLKCI